MRIKYVCLHIICTRDDELLTMKKILQILPIQFILPLFVIGGILAGLGAYTVYMSRAYSYLSDSPDACINCHTMTPYYATWQHSVHAQWATCNDCHVPHDNVLEKYAFKAKDGLYHAAVFTLRKEPIAIRPREESYRVIMDNCIRCHTDLNTAMVKTGLQCYKDVQDGNAKACWDCHRDVVHGTMSSIVSAPNALVPLPKSPVPEWLKKQMNKK